MRKRSEIILNPASSTCLERSRKIQYPVSSILFIFIAFLLFSSCGSNSDSGSPQEVLVFAAAGTRSVCEELIEVYQKDNMVKCNANYASTGILANQIQKGVQADIFISANKQWVDYLLAANLLDSLSVKVLAYNQLAVIAPKDKEENIHFNKDFNLKEMARKSIAMGDPGYVPVGKYTSALFDSLQWQSKLKDNLILAKDVSSVLKYVEMGEVDLGFVYYTEALLSQNVTIVDTVPTALYPPIVFYIAKTKFCTPQAIGFYNFITSNQGKQCFIQKGFLQ